MIADIKLAAIGLLIILCFLLGAHAGWSNHKFVVAREAWQIERVTAIQAFATEQARARAEETRRFQLQREAFDAQVKETEDARASARRSDAALAGLRNKLADIAARHSPASSDPAVADAGKAVEVLADLYGRSVEEYRSLGIRAEQARIAGTLCERSYDALTPAHE